MSDTKSAHKKPDDHGIRPGAILFLAEEAVSIPSVVRIAVKAFMEGKKLGLPFPELPVTAYISGPARRQRTMTSEIAMDANSPTIVHLEHQFDHGWTRPESLQLADAALRKSNEDDPCAIVAYQDLPDVRELGQFKEGFLRLDSAAKSASSVFALIVRAKDLRAVAPLHLEQDVALISACEPDPEFVEAFDVQWQHADGLLKKGLGHSLVQFGDGGKSSARSFTGKSYQIRRIHAGVGAGRSQARVAADLNVKAHLVCRMLAEVKRYPPRNDADKWYLEQVSRSTSKDESTPAD